MYVMDYRKILSLLYLSIFSITVAYSQSALPIEREWLAIQPRVGYMLNFHSSSLSGLNNIQECGIFTHGVGSAINFGLSLESPLSSQLYTGINIGLKNRKGTLYQESNPIYPILNATTNTVTNAEFENRIASSLQYLDVSPEIKYHLLDIGKSSVRAGAKGIVAFPMSPTFTQSQQIVQPDNATYVKTQTQTITISSENESIKNITSPLIGAGLSIENLLPVGKSSAFTQQVSLEYMFNNITTTESWKVFSVMAELGLRFSLQKSPELPPPPPPVKKDTLIPPPIVTYKPEPIKPLPILTARIDSLNAILQTGNELRASLPLVNAVFFELNGSEIPSRYITDPDAKFEADSAVEFHRAILRSMANIMKQNPKATLVLEGSTSGSEEKDGIALAKKRAENVESALERFGVSKDRIAIKTSVNPRVASNQEFPEGREENRRVEIVVNDAPLQEYVARQKFVQIKGEMVLDIDAKYLENETIHALTNVVPEQTFAGTERRKVAFTQRLQSDEGLFKITLEANVPPRLNSNDEAGIELTTLKRELIELSLISFDAILRFDYNSSEMTIPNKELLKQLIEKLPAGATIEILGSADILGQEQRNKELSERRAKTTEAFVRSISGTKFNITSGVVNDKFDDTKPEGRFLNRSIRIRVK